MSFNPKLHKRLMLLHSDFDIVRKARKAERRNSAFRTREQIDEHDRSCARSGSFETQFALPAIVPTPAQVEEMRLRLEEAVRQREVV